MTLVSEYLKKYWLYLILVCLLGFLQIKNILIKNDLKKLQDKINLSQFEAVNDSIKILYNTNYLIKNLEDTYANEILHTDSDKNSLIDDLNSDTIRVQLKTTEVSNPKQNTISKAEPTSSTVCEPINKAMATNILNLKNSIEKDQKTIVYLQGYVKYLENIIEQHNLRVE